MGQWFDIGLQAGKTVAEKVDKFIKDEEFTPKNRKELRDGSVIYYWYTKWQPYWYEDEKKFLSLLHSFDGIDRNSEEYETTAYKLVAVGDEGGQDEFDNEAGYEIFDGLFIDYGINFPETFDPEPKETLNRERLFVIAQNAIGELIYQDGRDFSEMRQWCVDELGITEEEMLELGFSANEDEGE